jgi:hypothetical protein
VVTGTTERQGRQLARKKTARRKTASRQLVDS